MNICYTTTITKKISNSKSVTSIFSDKYEIKRLKAEVIEIIIEVLK